MLERIGNCRIVDEVASGTVTAVVLGLGVLTIVAMVNPFLRRWEEPQIIAPVSPVRRSPGLGRGRFVALSRNRGPAHLVGAQLPSTLSSVPEVGCVSPGQPP